MIKTGRWSNTLVANTVWRGDTCHNAHGGGSGGKLDSGGHRGDRHLARGAGSYHTVTGLANVTETLPLRGTKRKSDLGALYDSQAVVGGLVDVWTTINKVSGHVRTGRSIARVRAIVCKFM